MPYNYESKPNLTKNQILLLKQDKPLLYTRRTHC